MTSILKLHSLYLEITIFGFLKQTYSGAAVFNRGLFWQRLETATPGRFLVKLSFSALFRRFIRSDLCRILPPPRFQMR